MEPIEAIRQQAVEKRWRGRQRKAQRSNNRRLVKTGEKAQFTNGK